MFDPYLDFDPKTLDYDLVCPYCSYRHDYTSELECDHDTYLCSGCERRFAYVRYTDITFRTMTIPEGEEKP